MLKFIVLASLVAISTAQVLRISPANVGSAQPGQQQIIQLSGGGGGGGGGRRGPSGAGAGGLGAGGLGGGRRGGAGGASGAGSAGGAGVGSGLGGGSRNGRLGGNGNGGNGGNGAGNEKPSPFSFSFESEDEEGSKIARQETGDEQGTVTGEYSFTAGGIQRIVKYIADQNGFRADVKTNEPGTLTSAPADVIITSSAQ